MWREISFIHTYMAYCKMIVRTHNDTFEQYFPSSSSSYKKRTLTHTLDEKWIKSILKECSHGNCILPTTMTQYTHAHTYTYIHVSASKEMESKAGGETERKCHETKTPTRISTIRFSFILFYSSFTFFFHFILNMVKENAHWIRNKIRSGSSSSRNSTHTIRRVTFLNN